jgi:hypothetical protein
MRAFSRLNFMTVLNEFLFLMYLDSSRLFHSKGKEYRGDFLKSSVRGFGSMKLSALRSGLSPWLTKFLVHTPLNELGA